MRLDYDRIADGYDAQPYRDKSADPDLAEFLQSRTGGGFKGLAVLDVGCGTGNQLVANLARWPEVRLAGLEPYRGMLRRALAKSRDIAWTRGDGAALPFRTATFDFATSQYSFHHVAHKERMLHEIRRVLRPGGRFVMSNIDPWAMQDSHLYRYFPAALEADRRDFPTQAVIEGWMRQAHFERIESSVQRIRIVQTRRRFAASVALRESCSQLMTISDEEYAAGMRRMNADLERPGSGDEEIASSIVFLKIRGDVTT